MPDLGHADVRLLGQPLDRAGTSQRSSSDWGLSMNAHNHHAFRGPLGQRQRNEGSAEAENGGKNQQAARTALHQMHAERILDDEQHEAEQCEDRDIGQDKEENAFTWTLVRKKKPQYGNAAH